MTRKSDFWISLLLMGLTAAAALLTLDVPGHGTGAGPGPNFVPWLMIGGLALFSLLLLVRTLSEPSAVMGRVSLPLLAKLGGFFVMMLVYAVAYEPVGYLASSLTFFVAALFVLGERRLAYLTLVPLGVVVTLYLVFTQIMKVYMP